jgi:hypothetical protein
MADYLEIRELFNDSDLINRVTVAMIVSVGKKMSGTPAVKDRAYADKVYSNPTVEAQKALMSVLAVNVGATVIQIKEASDTDLQSNVDTAVDVLIDALAGV